MRRRLRWLRRFVLWCLPARRVRIVWDDRGVFRVELPDNVNPPGTPEGP